MKNIAVRLRLLALAVVIGVVVSLVTAVYPASVKAQFTGNESHLITLDQALKYIQNFKQNPVPQSVKGGYFGRNIFDKILAQGGAVGIRYYFAAKNDGSTTLVLVGVDSTGNDIVQGVLGEEQFPCPPIVRIDKPVEQITCT